MDEASFICAAADPVYKDGHVMSNGQTWYPGNNGQTVACSNPYFTVNGYGYGYNISNQRRTYTRPRIWR